MVLSFKMIRNLGLLAILAILVVMGLVALTSMGKIRNSLSLVVEEERPKLEKAYQINELFISARDIFLAFVSEEITDITPAMACMNEAIKTSTALKEMVTEKEKEEVEKFITYAKRFKVAVNTYAGEFKFDPTGARTISMGKIALTTAKEVNECSNKIVKDIRARITTCDENVINISMNSQKMTLGGLLIGIVAGLLVALFMGRGLSIPLRNLITTTTLATKAADLTQMVEVKTKDEIGQLGLAYNKLTESLRGIISQIRDASLRVTTATNQILTASQQQATGIEEEATQISQTATSAKQLATTSKQVTDLSNEISKSSISSVQMANSGVQSVDIAIAGMEKIRQSVLETSKKIEGLSEKGQAINEVVTLIDDIANQTNLLSLNASIEAARAGEAGKGFAVVADAIGKLADRTTKSTKDISDLIKGIQQDTSGCVMSMEESTKETEKGSSLVQEAGKAIKELVSSFEHVAQSAKEILLASQQQMSGATQISKGMMGIDDIMKQSAAGAKQSTESARELVTLADEFKKIIGGGRLGEKEEEKI